MKSVSSIRKAVLQTIVVVAARRWSPRMITEGVRPLFVEPLTTAELDEALNWAVASGYLARHVNPDDSTVGNPAYVYQITPAGNEKALGWD